MADSITSRFRRLVSELGASEVARRLGAPKSTLTRWLSVGVPVSRRDAVQGVVRRSEAARLREKDQAKKKRPAGPLRKPVPTGKPVTPPRVDPRKLLATLIDRLGSAAVASRANVSPSTLRAWLTRPLSPGARETILRIYRRHEASKRARNQQEQIRRFEQEQRHQARLANIDAEIQKKLAIEDRVAAEMQREFSRPRPVQFVYPPSMKDRLLSADELRGKAGLPSAPYGEPLDPSLAGPKTQPVREDKKRKHPLPPLPPPRVLWPEPDPLKRKRGTYVAGYLQPDDLPFHIETVKDREIVLGKTLSYADKTVGPLFGLLIEEITEDGHESESIRALAQRIIALRDQEDPTKRAPIAAFIEVHRYIPNSPGYYDEHGQVLSDYKGKIGTWRLEPHGNLRLVGTFRDLVNALTTQLGNLWFKSLGRYLVLQAIRLRVYKPSERRAA